MKHYIVELTYHVPFDQMTDVLPLHRAFLQKGYERGDVLCSGPQLPKTGGIIVMRAESLEAIRAFFTDDPFQARGLASYRFIEFDMVKWQPNLDNWR